MNFNFQQNKALNLQYEMKYELAVNHLYQAQCLPDIQQQLEAQYGVTINKTSFKSQLKLTCQNAWKKINPEFKNCNEYLKEVEDSGCPFSVKFQLQQRKGQPTYRLKSLNLTHNSNCFIQKQARFIKKRKLLLENEEAISKIVKAMKIKKGKRNKKAKIPPTQVEKILCYEGIMQTGFIMRDKGIKRTRSEQKIKKNLDNLTLNSRRLVSTNWYIDFPHSYWAVTVDQYDLKFGLQLTIPTQDAENAHGPNNQDQNSIINQQNKDLTLNSQKSNATVAQSFEQEPKIDENLPIKQEQQIIDADNDHIVSCQEEEYENATLKERGTCDMLQAQDMNFPEYGNPNEDSNMTPEEQEIVNIFMMQIQEPEKSSIMPTRIGSDSESKFESKIEFIEKDANKQQKINKSPRKTRNKAGRSSFFAL